MGLIIGVGPGREEYGWVGGVPCAFCGAPRAMALTEYADTLFLLQAPLLFFRRRYYLECPFCGAAYALEYDAARRLCRVPVWTGGASQLRVVRRGMALCSRCGLRLPPEMTYCVRCGSRLFQD